MKNKRLRKYLQQKAARKTGLIPPEDRKANPAKHTNQDFTGYPHAPAKKEIIKPETPEEKKTAAVNVKDAEKIIDPKEKKKNKPTTANKINEEQSDGSANAFDATERVQE
jgi:hypothetical protein